MIVIKKILVTTDLSDYSRAAFDHAFSLGLLYGARIYLLYVASDAPALTTIHGMFGDEHALHKQVEQAAMQKLQAFVAAHVDPQRDVDIVARTGDAAAEIAHFAEEEHIDLIVMATHGWTGLKHLMLGSVAETVVRRSKTPVLTVKPPSEKEPIMKRQDVESELHLN